MRQRGLLIAGWAVATVLAVALGLQGIRAVSDSVSDDQRSALSQSNVRAALDRTSTSSSFDAGSSESSSAGDASAASTPDVSVPDASTSSAGEVQVSSSSAGATASEAEDPVAPPAEDRTYQLVGGTVSVRFENGAAHLLWATPAPGFEVDQDGSDSHVDIRFRSDDHESRLKAFWSSGPQQEIEERDT